LNTRRRFTLLGADFLRLLTVVLLGLPLAANAALTTWEIRGHITASQGAELAAFQPGDPFRILVNFDRAAGSAKWSWVFRRGDRAPPTGPAPGLPHSDE